jgi:hypothetical protein
LAEMITVNPGPCDVESAARGTEPRFRSQVGEITHWAPERRSHARAGRGVGNRRPSPIVSGRSGRGDAIRRTSEPTRGGMCAMGQLTHREYDSRSCIVARPRSPGVRAHANGHADATRQGKASELCSPRPPRVDLRRDRRVRRVLFSHRRARRRAAARRYTRRRGSAPRAIRRAGVRLRGLPSLRWRDERP